MKFKLALFCIVPLAIFGCAKGGETASSSSGTTGVTGSANTGGGSTSGTTDGTATSLDKIPAELKNEAFDYYGLGNTNPIDMEIVISGSSSVLTGSQTNKLMSVDSDGAIFDVERTGGLAQLGAAKVKLKADGIYLDEVMGTKVKEAEMELPNDLSPGKTWTSHMAFSKDGNSMDVTSVCTVKGVVKFKTKAGEREGVLVVASGSGKMNGQNIKLESKNWHVKGIGLVKSELTTIDTKSGKKSSVNIEEAKPK